jgi:hypothetical protein
MGVWVNWGLVVGAIAFIMGDLVLEVYESVNLAVLGLFLLAGRRRPGDHDRFGARVYGGTSPPRAHASEARFRALARSSFERAVFGGGLEVCLSAQRFRAESRGLRVAIGISPRAVLNSARGEN